MPLLATITQTLATSTPPVDAGNLLFDDLKSPTVGNWPNSQNVKAIKELIIYTNSKPVTRVVGLSVTYEVYTGPQPDAITHGNETEQATTITVKPHQLVTGIYGQLENGTNRIASINVVIFDAKEGKVIVKGQFWLSRPLGKEIDTPENVFGSFGNIIGFAGTVRSPAGLLSLSFYKSTADVNGSLLP